jgi:hypothetical protein
MSACIERVGKAHYFSTHGCKRLGSCLLEGVLEELACAAACCRAFRLKKSAMMSSCGGLEVAGITTKLKWNADATRSHVPEAQTTQINHMHIKTALHHND